MTTDVNVVPLGSPGFPLWFPLWLQPTPSSSKPPTKNIGLTCLRCLFSPCYFFVSRFVTRNPPSFPVSFPAISLNYLFLFPRSPFFSRPFRFPLSAFISPALPWFPISFPAMSHHFPFPFPCSPIVSPFNFEVGLHGS